MGYQTATCPSCDAELIAAEEVCHSCGAAVTGAAVDASAATIGAGIVEQNLVDGHTRIKKSSRWLLYLSIMFAIFGTFIGMSQRSEAREAMRALSGFDDSETLIVDGDEYTVAELKDRIDLEVMLAFVLNYALALGMLGLFFWARTNPFYAMVAGLCLYIGVIVFNAAYDPETLAKGILIKLIIITVLATGIKAAYEERAAMRKMPRARLT